MIVEVPDLKLRNPYLSLAFEEVMTEYFSSKDDISAVLRFWINPPCIILGRTCKIEKDVNFTNIEKEKRKIPILRRLSGGGTVYHSPDNLNYSIIINLKKNPEFYSIPESYKIILGFVIRSLEKQDIYSEMKGLSDLIIYKEGNSKKISGNSQFRKYGMLLHHGTLILQKSIIEDIEKFLKHPPTEPAYRNQRKHRDFMVSLPSNFDISLFYHCLLQELKNYFKDFDSRLMDKNDFQNMRSLLINKTRRIYYNREWVFEGKYNYKEITKKPS